MIRLGLIILLFIYVCETSYTQYYGSRFNDRGISFCQSNEDFFLTGTTRGLGEGSEDIWFIKVNDELEEEFHVEWGGPHYDINGKLLHQVNYSGQLKTIYFDPQLPRGAYIYQVKTNETVHRGKIIIN